MDKFQYRFVTVHTPESREAPEELDDLNALGAQGWEAVGFSPATAGGRGLHVTTSTYVILLKRRRGSD